MQDGRTREVQAMCQEKLSHDGDSQVKKQVIQRRHTYMLGELQDSVRQSPE